MAREPSACPTCGKPAWPAGAGPERRGAAAVDVAGRPTPDPFPFCSFRCQMVDLGRWIDEEYRIADPDDASGGGVDGAPAPGDDGLT